MRNIKKEKMKRNSKESIKNALLKVFIGKDTLYMLKHGGAAHFQDKLVEDKIVRITTVDGEIFEGLVVDYVYPDINEPEKDETVVLDRPTRNDGYKYLDPVRFNVSDIKSAEIVS